MLALVLSSAAAALPASKRQGSDFPYAPKRPALHPCRRRGPRSRHNEDVRVATSHILQEISTDGKTITKQNFDSRARTPGTAVSTMITMIYRDVFIDDIDGFYHSRRRARRSPKDNFIDGFYHALDASNDLWPTNVDIVKGYFAASIGVNISLARRGIPLTSSRRRIAACSGDTPIKNFTDYFVY
ncbi:hypothetical protein K466DRAFT_603714 [Polyporus arcularius HHB13444]|uniref:Uncharacterized protein n=1 Tax=Polyporus arcularius HHB13444 TaxID=1314778 RepID=A0A5C3NY80_9APHY|nr:hypothetical protein K466DRAFT_603714 [Polyporus arcularius HHB13444]